MSEISQFTGPIGVTITYILLYYAFQLNGMRVKTRLQAAYKARGEKFDRYFGNDREMLAADRVQLNTLEHMPPFLVLLWLNAVFVGPWSAAVAGSVYIMARLTYPFLIGERLGRGIQMKVVLATGLGYSVIGYYCVALVWAALQ